MVSSLFKGFFILATNLTQYGLNWRDLLRSGGSKTVKFFR
ncbi:hypothetical protein CRENPOLYSF1_200003 [Crenothrix polyspora]|uniref:Uncharacterized protein n=1 Tax=Crenothrix polyspora TaxID=360316 RepID=A0A1R4H5T8_9GAMM|nr:hypothetical protein CRENPOLYSF1_200003 [Crenothrix polyspora]